MNKVYCVFIDKGSWDSYSYKLDKVFSDKEKAEGYAKSINDYYSNLKQLVPKDKSEEDDFDMNTYEEYLAIHSKECDDFKDKYDISTYDVEEFNECTVVEFEVN